MDLSAVWDKRNSFINNLEVESHHIPNIDYQIKLVTTIQLQVRHELKTIL